MFGLSFGRDTSVTRIERLGGLKARVYYSDSVIRNPTPSPRRPLEPSQFSVGMSDTQRNSPPDRSYMLTTNHVNSVGIKLPKLFKSYVVFY